jgi:hypothetical protein
MLRRTCALVSIAFALSLFSVTGAATTAKRTFVASTGNDANPCSITAPCRGFTRAITQTSASGEVVVLDSAGYGVVTIKQSVSIIAPAGIYAGISVFSGDGVTVNAPGATVVLRGISINGQGSRYGIFVQAAARLRIENCIISELGSGGIHFTATGAEMIVLDTIVRDNGGSGIGVIADGASIDLHHVRIEHHSYDGFHITPAPGSLGVRATITDSVFTHNGGDGISADSVSGATITLVVERSVMSNNGTNGFRAAASAGSGVATLSRNTVNDNGGNGILIQAGVDAFAFENVVHRNSGAGIFADVNAQLYLSGNAGHANLAFDVDCASPSPGRIDTYSNNSWVDFVVSANICFSKVGQF